MSVRFDDFCSLVLFKKDLIFNFTCLITKTFKLDANGYFWLVLNFCGPLGSQFIFIRLNNLKHRTFLFSDSLASGDCFFLSSFRVLKQVILSVKKTLIGICCGYFTRFSLIGYNYKFKSSLRFSYLVLFLGHCFSVLVKLPKTVKIFKKKRSFVIFGTNLVDFNFTVSYLRHLRDLYPYKTRGLEIENESVLLKKDKKLKVR